MYNYQLINNHYVVNIDGQNFLIDTGTPTSFMMSNYSKNITINGNNYYFYSKPNNVDINETNNLIGLNVAGFIGMDIVIKNGLTIYKNGLLDFNVIEEDGNFAPMTKSFPLMIDVICDSHKGRFIIDMGAKYGYGVSKVFNGKSSFDHVHDYNPNLGHIDSDIYHLNIVINGQEKAIDVCNNSEVYQMLNQFRSLIIGNITTFFDEVCVLDTKNGKFVFK